MSQVTNTVVFAEYYEGSNYSCDPNKSFFKVLLVNNINKESALFFIPLSILADYPAAQKYVHEEESPNPQERIQQRKKRYAVLCHEIAQLKPLKFFRTKLTGLAFTKSFPNFSFTDFFARYYKLHSDISTSPNYEKRSISQFLNFLQKQEGVACKTMIETLLSLSIETPIDRAYKIFKVQMEALIKKYHLSSNNHSILIWELIINKILKNSNVDIKTKAQLWDVVYEIMSRCTEIIIDMQMCYRENAQLAFSCAAERYHSLIELLTLFNNRLNNFSLEENTLLEIRNLLEPLKTLLEVVVNSEKEQIEKFYEFQNNFIVLRIHNLFKSSALEKNDVAEAPDLLNVIEQYQNHFIPSKAAEINATTELKAIIFKLQENFPKRGLNLETHLLITQFYHQLNSLPIHFLQSICFKIRNLALMTVIQEAYHQEIMDNFNGSIFKEMNSSYRLLSKKPQSVRVQQLSNWSLDLKKQKYPLLHDLIISLKTTWEKMKMTRLELTNQQLATKLEDFRLQHERGAIEEATQLYLGIAEILKPYLTEWVTSLKSLNSIVSEIQEACTFLILHPRLPKRDILDLVEDFKVLNKHFLSLITPVTKFFNFFICLLGNQNPENATQRDQLFADFSQEEVFNLELFSEDVDSYQNLVQEREELAEKCANIPQEFHPPSQEKALVNDKSMLETGINQAFSNLKTRHILQELFQLFNKHGIKFDLQPSGQGGSHRLLHIGNKLVPFPKHTTWKAGTSLSIQKLLKQAIETQTALLPAKDKTLYTPTK